mmetsp:Transcript_90561/g.143031  ORF Transcript_90561/g.143031 Transcript_90561/m.143031 type:complete len:243 (-) Transcript_90561:27-755(-)
MNKENRISDIGLRAFQQLEVGLMNRVAILESNYLLSCWQSGAHIGRSFHWIRELGTGQAMNFSSDVKATFFGHHRKHGGVLQAGCSVAFLRFHNFVWLVDGFSLKHSHVFTLPFQQNLVTFFQAICFCNVKNDWQSEDFTCGQAHAFHHAIIFGLCHETFQWTECSMNKTPHIASLTLVEFKCFHRCRSQTFRFTCIINHQLRQRPTMWSTCGKCANSRFKQPTTTVDRGRIQACTTSDRAA